MPRGNVCIVVLAAGRSERFGSAKLLAELGGKPLLHYALSAAQATCPGNVYLVAGHNAHEIRAAAAGLADHIVINEDYADGIGSSIARGVRASREQSDAIIITLADQPLVSPAHLARLMEMWAGGPSEIIASVFGYLRAPGTFRGRDVRATRKTGWRHGRAGTPAS